MARSGLALATGVVVACIQGVTSAGDSPSAYVTYSFDSFEATGGSMLEIFGVSELVGTLTGVSVDVVLNSDGADNTWASDFTILVGSAGLSTTNLQAGGYIHFGADEQIPWSNGYSGAAGTTVVDDQDLATPLDISTLTVYLANGYYSDGLTDWGGSITLIGVRPALAIVLTTQPSSSASNGVAFVQQPVLQLLDGNDDANAMDGVVVTASIASGGGTLGGTTTATTDENGVATFTDLSIAGLVGDRTLQFSAEGYANETSETITLTPGSAASLAIATQPSSFMTSGIALPRQPVIQVTDSSGNAVAISDIMVTATIASGGGTLAGTTTATTDPNGVATFTDLSITGGPGSRTLEFLSEGLSGVTSETITPSVYVTYSFDSFEATGGSMLEIFSAGELVGTLTGVSVDAVLNSDGADYTWAYDLTILVGSAGLSTTNLQAGGFINFDADERIPWSNGYSGAAGTPVVDDQDLATPLDISTLTVYLANGFNSDGLTDWGGSITLIGVEEMSPCARDTDGDGANDCIDECPNDPNKTEPGTCGCGIADTDSDGDGTPDCDDACPYDADNQLIRLAGTVVTKDRNRIPGAAVYCNGVLVGYTNSDGRFDGEICPHNASPPQTLTAAVTDPYLGVGLLELNTELDDATLQNIRIDAAFAAQPTLPYTLTPPFSGASTCTGDLGTCGPTAMAQCSLTGTPSVAVTGSFYLPDGHSCVAMLVGPTGATCIAESNRPLLCAIEFDGHLYVGGYDIGGGFTIGNSSVHGVARWDGSTWSSVGNGLDGVVDELVVFDDGTGPALYASGSFPGLVARWDGTAWTTVAGGLFRGSCGGAWALAVHNDGSGETLYCGGASLLLDGVPISIARLSAGEWEPVAALDPLGTIETLCSVTHSDTPRLFAGGSTDNCGDFCGDISRLHVLANGALTEVPSPIPYLIRDIQSIDIGGQQYPLITGGSECQDLDSADTSAAVYTFGSWAPIPLDDIRATTAALWDGDTLSVAGRSTDEVVAIGSSSAASPIDPARLYVPASQPPVIHLNSILSPILTCDVQTFDGASVLGSGVLIGIATEDSSLQLLGNDAQVTDGTGTSTFSNVRLVGAPTDGARLVFLSEPLLPAETELFDVVCGAPLPHLNTITLPAGGAPFAATFLQHDTCLVSADALDAWLTVGLSELLGDGTGRTTLFASANLSGHLRESLVAFTGNGVSSHILVRQLASGEGQSWGLGKYNLSAVPDSAAGNAISASSSRVNHALVLDNGTVHVWGLDSDGQAAVPSFLKIPSTATAIQIAMGRSHVLTLLADGTLVSWGRNADGQTDVPAGSGFVSIAAGRAHSLAVRADGTVAAWGRNQVGQCDVPAGLTGVVAVTAGDWHSVALKSDGTVVAWGYNNFGQSDVPAGLSGVMAIEAGANHTLALRTDGTVQAWGDNRHGQSTPRSSLQNPDTAAVVQISAARRYSVALTESGDLVYFGAPQNGAGVPPSDMGNVVGISAGDSSTLALVRPSTAIEVTAGGLLGGAGAAGATLLVPESFDSIGDAVAEAGEGSVILVGPGVYRERIDLGDRGLKLIAIDAPGEVVLDGTGLAGAVVTIGAAAGSSTSGLTTRLEGFTIVGGVAEMGGGVRVDRAVAEIVGCTIRDNVAALGGGIAVSMSDLLLERTAIAGNIAEVHGGGVHASASSLMLSNSTIAENLAGVSGGGLWSDEESIMLRTSVSLCGNLPEEAAFGNGEMPPVEPAACPAMGDLNHDGAVDAADLALLMGSWGACGGCVADLDGDGEVDGADLALLMTQWMEVPRGG